MPRVRVRRQSQRLFIVGCLALGTGGVGRPASAQLGPAPVPTRLSPEVLALACAPLPLLEAPAAALRIAGAQDSVRRRTFAPGDLVVVSGGENQGIAVGQEYYVRRVVGRPTAPPTRERPAVVHTAGWIRIYAIHQNLSLATITHACDTVNAGDYLEPFLAPAVPAAASKESGVLHHEAYGRVLVGLEQRTTFGKGDVFLLDRGSDHGVTPGMQFVTYRDKHEPGVFLFELGEAVAFSVQRESATLLVTRARDAVRTGDYVAMRR